MEYRQWTSQDLDGEERLYRRNLFNRLTGSRTVWLLGTRSLDGNSNLGLFSQIVHVSTSPPLIGIVFRPETPRHQTLENIRQTRSFTLNSVRIDHFLEAHRTSAAYAADVNEFEASGLKEERIEGFHAPFVKDALVKIALEPMESHTIESNLCRFVVAKVQEFSVREDQLDSDRLPSPEDWLNVSGLDLYMSNNRLTRLSDAQP